MPKANQKMVPQKLDKTKIWSLEAKRIIIRYNYQRGLAALKCYQEMRPSFGFEKDLNSENANYVYNMYRELRKGILCYVGNFTKPVSPYEDYCRKLALRRARNRMAAEARNASEDRSGPSGLAKIKQEKESDYDSDSSDIPLLELKKKIAKY